MRRSASSGARPLRTHPISQKSCRLSIRCFNLVCKPFGIERQTCLLTNRISSVSSGSPNATKSSVRLDTYTLFRNPNGKTDNDRWWHISDALLNAVATGKVAYPAIMYGDLTSAYLNNNVAGFNRIIREYNQYLARTIPEQLSRPRLEFFFNQAQPFLQAMVLYVIVLIFALFSWLKWPKTLGKTAIILLVFAFLLHTFGLLFRMYLQGRPPVTNLYSSALFVGWGSVLLCLFLERFYKNGIGSVCASAIGFVTLLIAHNLQLDGDSFEMLRAVLDTNVWLATHVVMVTLGYSSVALAGFLGIIYILRGLFTTSFSETTASSLSRMMYGIICFATCSASLEPSSAESGLINLGGDSGDGTQRRMERFLSYCGTRSFFTPAGVASFANVDLR